MKDKVLDMVDGEKMKKGEIKTIKAGNSFEGYYDVVTPTLDEV